MELTLYREYRDVVVDLQVRRGDRPPLLPVQPGRREGAHRGRRRVLRGLDDRRLGVGHVPPGPVRQERQGADLQGRQRRGAQPRRTSTRPRPDPADPGRPAASTGGAPSALAPQAPLPTRPRRPRRAGQWRHGDDGVGHGRDAGRPSGRTARRSPPGTSCERGHGRARPQLALPGGRDRPGAARRRRARGLRGQDPQRRGVRHARTRRSRRPSCARLRRLAARWLDGARTSAAPTCGSTWSRCCARAAGPSVVEHVRGLG